MFQIQLPGDRQAGSDWLGGTQPPWATPSDGYGGASRWNGYGTPWRTIDAVRPLFTQPLEAGTSANGPASVGGAFGSAGNSDVIQQLVSMLGSLLSALFGAAGSVAAQGSGDGPNGFDPMQKFYTNASVSSVGDPHLHFEGTTGAGKRDAATWDNMNGHRHFLVSDSVAGGFDLATEVTDRSAEGTTMNRRVTLATGGGATSVSMDNGGAVTIARNGTNVPIFAGQTIDLGNGESATANADGSLNVTASAMTGGSIVTTMRANGGGVDVSATATNVDLGGYAVRHTTFAQAVP